CAREGRAHREDRGRQALGERHRPRDADPHRRDGSRRPIGVTVAGPAEDLRAELRALERAYAVGHHGRPVARRRAALVDACVAELFAGARPSAKVAVVATGGYGRMRQLPLSDIDLLVVHEEERSIGPLVDALPSPLWD